MLRLPLLAYLVSGRTTVSVGSVILLPTPALRQPRPLADRRTNPEEDLHAVQDRIEEIVDGFRKDGMEIISLLTPSVQEVWM